MRFGVVDGRLTVLTNGGAVDVEHASEGRFPACPDGVYPRWPDFLGWAAEIPPEAGTEFDAARAGCPIQHPSQIFAIGLNYREHAEETQLAPSEQLSVFTKFSSALTGPVGEVQLPTDGQTDWEAEVVVVIGKAARNVAADDAWGHVAGLTLGQDISDRRTQFAGTAPQFSLGKSFPGFAPIGPWIATVDEFKDRDAIPFGCAVNDETVQSDTTASMMVPIPGLIERLSRVVHLQPGDIIFTGTPAGVGWARSPQRFLQPGDSLTSWMSEVGQMQHTFVS